MNYLEILQQDIASHTTMTTMSLEDQQQVVSCIIHDAVKVSERIRRDIAEQEEELHKVGGTD